MKFALLLALMVLAQQSLSTLGDCLDGTGLRLQMVLARWSGTQINQPELIAATRKLMAEKYDRPGEPIVLFGAADEQMQQSPDAAVFSLPPDRSVEASSGEPSAADE